MMNRMSPFRSYSTETLNLFGTGANANDGYIPMPSHRGGIGTGGGSSGSLSQPRTPVSGLPPDFGSPRTPGAHTGRSLSIGSRSLGSGAGVHAINAGLSGGTSSGKTVREYDESFRELKKENFNLKLRIYFLEERLGSVAHGGGQGRMGGDGATTPAGKQSRDTLLQNNMDLKIQVESLKYDVTEKTELLREAGLALEQLENKVSTLTIEREEERQKLESKLRQIEDDFNENLVLNNILGPAAVAANHPAAAAALLAEASSPAKTPKKRTVISPEARDEDEKLLREVDEEIARGVPPPQLHSPTKPSLMLPLTELSALPLGAGVVSRPNFLAVVEEKAAEAEVEELSKALKDTEKTLDEAQQELQQRLKDMIALESELVNRDIQITGMQDELSNAKIEMAQSATAHLEELNVLLREHDSAVDKLHEAKSEIDRLKEKLSARDADVKTLTDKLSQINSQLVDLKSSLGEKDAMILKLQESQASSNATASTSCAASSKRTCPEGESPNFSIHTHQVGEFQIPSGGLQIVTQSLHISPSEDGGINEAEVERLRRDMRKLKEYLKTSVQERKLLLKKIGTLNQRIAEASKDGGIPSQALSMSMGRSTTTVQIGGPDEGVSEQDSLEHTPHGTSFTQLHNSRHLFLRIANLQQRLANACEDADVLRSHLESILDTLEPISGKRGAPVSPEALASLRRVVQESRQTSKAISRAPTPVVSDTTSGNNATRDGYSESLRSNSSMSSWKNGLPDPSGLDLEKEAADSSIIKHLSEEIDRRNQDMEHKMAVLDLLEEQLQERESIIQEQGCLLEDYRQEIVRMRDEEGVDASERGAGSDRKIKRYRSFTTIRRRTGSSGGGGPQPGSDRVAPQPAPRSTTRGLSDGEDSWSEPDVNASRKRMGLSTAVTNALLREKDSSETDLEKLSDGCNLNAPGSLDCLLPGVGNLFHAMDNLSYQLDLSDSFDSGNGSDEGEDTEVETSMQDQQDMNFQMCGLCSTLICEDFENCLTRSAQLILTSTAALRRLRRICSNFSTRLSKAQDNVTQQNHMLGQLEENLKEHQRKAKVAEHVHKELELTREDLSRKTKELQDVQVKINDNYKLVSELSNENLRLTGEKARADEIVEEVRLEHKRTKEELNAARRMVDTMREANAQPAQVQLLQSQGSKRDSLSSRHLRSRNADSAACSSPEPSSDTGAPYPALPAVMTSSLSRRSASALEPAPVLTTNKISLHRGRKKSSVVNIGPSSTTSSSTTRQLIRTDSDQMMPRSHSDLDSYSTSQHHHNRSYPSQPNQQATPNFVLASSSSGLGPMAASDISSPDLGVDVSSDPFSSLERSSTLSEAMGGNGGGNGGGLGSGGHTSLTAIGRKQEDGVVVDAMMLENRQLRLDRDLLMQKLIRSKGALKETLDRLALNNQHKQDQLSPLPPRRTLLSSSSVLSSVGSGPSRSRVTQDLLEFSRTHTGGSKRGEKHRPKKSSQP